VKGGAPGSVQYKAAFEQAAALGWDVSEWEVLEAETEDFSEFAFAWDVFRQLCETRSCGFGPNPISLSEIDAWGRLMRVELSVFEVMVVKALDDAWLREWAEKNARSGST
jgi:hypothetical protein